MKIGIDAKFASSRYGGLGTYTINIIEALVNLDQDEIVAFVPDALESEFGLSSTRSERLHIQTVELDENIPENFYDFRVYWEQEVLPAQLAAHNVDVFFGPAFMAPLKWNGPKVVTIHDLLFERSQHYNPERSTAYYLQWAKRCAEHVHAIIAVSQSTVDDIHTLWNINHVPIKPIYLAPALSFVPHDRDKSKTIVQTELGVHYPYLLYVGNSFPRKNLERLVRAYSLLTSSGTSLLQLVLVTSYDTDRVASLLAKYDVLDRAVITGHCASSLLPHVYKAAEMLVFPSLFEGFGLPALEAMLCDTPVIVSKTGALPEVVADAALFIDPLNIDEIKTTIENLLMNEALRSNLVSRGKQRIQNFSWNKTAKETRDVLEWTLTHHRQ